MKLARVPVPEPMDPTPPPNPRKNSASQQNGQQRKRRENDAIVTTRIPAALKLARVPVLEPADSRDFSAALEELVHRIFRDAVAQVRQEQRVAPAAATLHIARDFRLRYR
jgi:hypothetical protein